MLGLISPRQRVSVARRLSCPRRWLPRPSPDLSFSWDRGREGQRDTSALPAARFPCSASSSQVTRTPFSSLVPLTTPGPDPVVNGVPDGAPPPTPAPPRPPGAAAGHSHRHSCGCEVSGCRGDPDRVPHATHSSCCRSCPFSRFPPLCGHCAPPADPSPHAATFRPGSVPSSSQGERSSRFPRFVFTGCFLSLASETC